MTQAAWSVLLQWSRLGVNAALFLIVARYLTLAEIGAFATAFAPIRLLQVVHKSGIADAYLVSDKGESQRSAFFTLSVSLGLSFTAILGLSALILPDPIAHLMAALCPVPLIIGLSAIPEATLRADLRIKALALRTLIAQLFAAALALLALNAGWGAASLVVFALINALVTAIISIALARVFPTSLPTRPALRAALPDITHISARDLAGGATLPLMQLAVGAVLGLPAAGAFQIAARILSLLDALAISPIRYITLPHFAALVETPSLSVAVLRSLRLTSLIASFVYFGAMVVSADLLTISVGPAHTQITAPLLPAFCLLGLVGALAMSLNQSLTAIGHTRLTLYRALANLMLTALLAIPALMLSTTAAAAILPLAATLVLTIYARVALPILGINRRAALMAIAPALLAGALMAISLTTAEVSLRNLPPMLRLVFKIGLGAGFYSALILALNSLPRRPVSL